MRQLVCVLTCVLVCALLREGSARPDSWCPDYDDDTLDTFRKYGCTVSTNTRNGCVEITNCPQECVGADGTTRSTDGSMWKEGNNRCECVYLYQVGYHVRMPLDGKFPVTKDCKLEGCKESPLDTSFIEPGGQVTKQNGQTCQCVSGADPDRHDYITLYHLRCDA